MIKKLLILFFALTFIWGCDGIDDGAVNQEIEEIKVNDVSAPLTFTKTTTDSVITAGITFERLPEEAEVYLDVETSDGETSLYDNLKLTNPDSNDPLKFVTQIIMTTEVPSTSYNLIFFVSGTLSGTRKIATHSLTYNNGADNKAPEIVDIQMPDTVDVENQDLAFGLYASVEDSNGLRDIDEVWFTVVKPNGTSSGAKTYMYDDGSVESGDETPSDGTFSRVVRITPAEMKGTYIFQYRAKDKGGKMSNIVKREIVIL